jgi:hypothetical protein
MAPGVSTSIGASRGIDNSRPEAAPTAAIRVVVS